MLLIDAYACFVVIYFGCDCLFALSRFPSDVFDSCRSSSNIDDETEPSKPTEQESNDDVTEFFIPDGHYLAKLREKFCIQCLVILGEYVEVLGPVLHEKGVDVCLALLQRSFKLKETSSTKLLVNDILKLICALAAHRKFSALFVDRGGMQRLLATPRNAQTFFGLSSYLFTIGSIQVVSFACMSPVVSTCTDFSKFHFDMLCGVFFFPFLIVFSIRLVF